LAIDLHDEVILLIEMSSDSISKVTMLGGRLTCLENEKKDEQEKSEIQWMR
jgi:hypothetical protein